MLTEKEAFKAGFLIRCAQEGISDGEISSRASVGAEKSAHFIKEGQAAGASAAGLRFGWDAIKSPFKMVPWALGLGALGGVGIGTVAAGVRNKLDPDYGPEQVPEEIQDIQAAELAETLTREANTARRRAARIRRKREEEEAASRTRYRF
jgi:hypothetical protein